MVYRLFLDTNVYDGANYSFHNAQFRLLRSLASEGKLILVINAVIEGEVRAHIKRDVKKAVSTLNEATKARAFAGFRSASEYKDKLLISHPNEWINYAQNEFSEFLKDCAARKVSLNGIDVEAVVDDYFHQQPPFDHKKPYEFKDAIAVKSLVLDMNEAWDDCYDLIQYCIVSDDKGFVSAVKSAISGAGIEDYTLFFDSLTRFTDYLTEMDKQMQFMLKYLKSDYGEDFLKKAVNEALESDTYAIRTSMEIVDQDVSEVEVLSIIPHAISLTNTAGTPDVLEAIIEGEAIVTVDYTCIDTEQSYYDKETHTYLFAIEKVITEKHKVSYDIPMTFIVDDCLAEDNELDLDDEKIFVNKDIDLDTYTEQSFELTEDSMILREIVQVSGDESTGLCPDCGCKIGAENDGGNGFCINCAPNH